MSGTQQEGRLRRLRNYRRFSAGVLAVVCVMEAVALLSRVDVVTILSATLAPSCSLAALVYWSRLVNGATRELRRPDPVRTAVLERDTARPLAEIVAGAERKAVREFAAEHGEAAWQAVPGQEHRRVVLTPHWLHAVMLQQASDGTCHLCDCEKEGQW